MHERNGPQTQNGHLAKSGDRPRQPASGGPSQRPNAQEPVVTGGALHGAGLANSSQSPAGHRQRPNGPKADVERVRPSRHRDSRQDGEPSPAERLAQMGEKPSVGRESLHPQSQAPLVASGVPQGAVCVEAVLRLLEQQRYRCAMTGRRLTPQTAALDHIVPVRFGGEHLIENTQVLHKDVNRAKGSLTSEEFVGLCREVAYWAEIPSTPKEPHP